MSIMTKVQVLLSNHHYITTSCPSFFSSFHFVCNFLSLMKKHSQKWCADNKVKNEYKVVTANCTFEHFLCVVSGSVHWWIHNVKRYQDLMIRDACVMWKLVDAARNIIRYCKVCLNLFNWDFACHCTFVAKINIPWVLNFSYWARL